MQKFFQTLADTFALDQSRSFAFDPRPFYPNNLAITECRRIHSSIA